ncbi:hypothetical protein L0665_03535 [Methanogenium marinum]|uniref:Uncharacterized protein n=1 Tax=Methanogenium marinum TaxID=348610 RepID=A0A9Q4KS86_9EURY|nr:hypothetical protein [Methanogenium marinum]MDE4907684.1 hypothetical protein [Methanogenium marinum]
MVDLLNIVGKIIIAVFVLIVFLILVFAAIIGYIGISAAEDKQPVYDYSLTLSTSGPIDNVTLLIPVPSYYNADTGQNETVINMSRVSFNNFDRDGNISAEIEQVNGIPMLNISADRIDPIYKNYIEPIAIMPGQNESELPHPTRVYSNRYSEDTPVLVAMEIHMYETDVGHEIDTKSPVGKEPLFMPYRILENFSRSDGGMTDGYYLSEGAFGSFIEVPFILSYTAGDDNVLIISSEFEGSNQWWVLGWRRNVYRENIYPEFTGEAEGTYWVKGVLVTGEGVY